jgi:hypothetical protein
MSSAGIILRLTVNFICHLTYLYTVIKAWMKGKQKHPYQTSLALISFQQYVFKTQCVGHLSLGSVLFYEWDTEKSKMIFKNE